MRSLLILISIVACLCLLPLVAGYGWLQSEHFQTLFSDKASAALSRSVTLDEPIDIRFDGRPSLHVKGLRIANTAWGEKPYFAYIKEIDVAPRLLPLLRGKVVLDVIRARDGEVWFEKNESVGWNIPGSNDANPGDEGNADSKPFFRLSTISNAEISNVRLAKAEDPDDGILVRHLESQGGQGARFEGIVDERPLTLEWESNTSPWLLHDETSHELDVKAIYDGSTFTGTFVVDTENSPVFISGDIHSPEFKHKSRSDSSSSSPIPDQHLFTTWLTFFEARTNWTIDKFIVGKFEASDVTGTTTVRDGELRIHPAAGRLGDGQVEFSAVLAAPVDLPSLRVTGQIDGYNLSNRLDLFEPSKTGDGRIDIRFDVHGVGDNVQHVASSLDGGLQLVMSQARISNRTLQRLTSDLGALLDPFSEEKSSTPVRCLAIRLNIKDGIADVEQMVMDTREALIVGQGNINLRNGQIDLLLLPDDHGIELTKLQLPIKISGPMNRPDADPEPSAILQRAGRDILGMLTGEDGLFDEPLRRRFSNSGEGCAATLEAYGVGDTASAE